MWQRIMLDCEWGGAPSIRFLFGNERAVPAILEFLERTTVRKVPGRALLAGGHGLEGEELEIFSLQVLGEEEEVSDVSSSEEEDGLDPPL